MQRRQKWQRSSCRFSPQQMSPPTVARRSRHSSQILGSGSLTRPTVARAGLGVPACPRARLHAWDGFRRVSVVTEPLQ